jgi:Fe2+ or Zn2+ uptake regulation protein
VCHREDVLKVIKENPGRKWSNAEIVQALPSAKRSNAKQYVYALLSSFTKEGLIQRIAPGIYVCQSPKDAAEEA